MNNGTPKRTLVKFGKWAGLGLLIVAASCVQALDGAYDYRPICSVDVDCDDANPCTIDECLPDNTCGHAAAMDGLLPSQAAGDCKREECSAGELVVTNDDADIADDGEPCTMDACSAGSAVHTPVVDGTSCILSATTGTCSAGVCSVECSSDTQCDDANPCTKDSCNVGVGTCIFAQLDGMPTPGFQEPVGDCQLHICQLGVDTPVNDDSDLPDDMNPCTENVCTAGIPSNPGLPAGVPCVLGQAETCDGLGTCVQCNVPADCVSLPSDDDCQQRTCVNNVCGQTFTATGTPTTSTPAQISSDCQRVVCDGNGGTQIENFDTDLPIDSNPCTKDICINGSPSNPLEAQDFACGVNQVCDSLGHCVGCNNAAQCVGVDDFCKMRTCINQICGYTYTAAGIDLPTGQTSQDCKVFECDGMGTVVENPDSTDKPVDGNQCTLDVCTAGVPSNPFEMVNVACNQSGGTVCNGAGVCAKANSATCAAGSECLSGFCVDGVCCNATCGATCKSCNVPGSIGTCVNVPKASEDLPGCTGTNSCDGAGTCKKDDAQGCAGATDCVSNFCVDGVCCSSACTTACRVCNAMGSVGVCTTITSGEDPVATTPCTGMKACDSAGVCKSKDGNTCAANTDCVSGQCFDGVCCNMACSGTCKSCNTAAMVGICSNVALGQDDANGVPSCSGANQSCDGMGVCKKENGQTCGVNTECLSGFCADGVCCNSACSATCQACNLPGTLGTCANVAIGQDDVGTCSGTNQSCDGVGACKSELGFVCSISPNCLSGFCVDGYCCNTACTGMCQACSAVVAGQGTNGTCTPIISGTDPDNECASGSCNGAAACKADNGIACTMAPQCLSGFCVDGVCCNASCSATCKSCNATGSVGICVNTPAGQDDPNALTTCSGANVSCDGAGVCRKENGQTCLTGTECLSFNCVDGVCCNTTCMATCEACVAAKKGNGTDGTCGPIATGLDPDNECAGSTSCNGAGLCQ